MRKVDQAREADALDRDKRGWKLLVEGARTRLEEDRAKREAAEEMLKRVPED